MYALVEELANLFESILNSRFFATAMWQNNLISFVRKQRYNGYIMVI